MPKQKIIKKACNAAASKTAKQTIIFSNVQESEQAKFTSQRDSKTDKTNRTKKQKKTQNTKRQKPFWNISKARDKSTGLHRII